MWDVLLDALVDSAKILPFLFVIYLLIEFLERNKKAKYATVKLLNGKVAPLVAGAVGIVPQCGFSVMATDLFCQNYLKLGTLVAIFIATSDEALPLLLSNSKTVGLVWLVVLIKVVYAIIVGYLVNLFDRRILNSTFEVHDEEGCCGHELFEGENNGDSSSCDLSSKNSADSKAEGSCNVTDETTDAGKKQSDNSFVAFCKRLWMFVKHPILHTVKIFAYIFVVNVFFGLILYYFKDNIVAFTSKLGIFQSFITAAIGLVPNCASSVIITGMFIPSADGVSLISFSAMIAGLVSNSGIAVAILFKDKNNIKRNILILLIMYLSGVVLGLLCDFAIALF